MKNINQIFKVPNTVEGAFFLAQAKKFLSPCYKLRAKGRTINDKKLRKSVKKDWETNTFPTNTSLSEATKKTKRWRNNDGSIPLSLADNIGIYIDCREKKLGTIGAANEALTHENRDEHWKTVAKAQSLYCKLTNIKNIVGEL